MSSEASDVDAMIERMTTEEQDDLDRAGGQFILDAVAASEARRQGSTDDPLLKAIEEAHRARAQEDNQQ